MFTVKQETEHGHKIWPGINHVYTSPDTAPGQQDAVYALFQSGGDLQFIASENRHVIYVMNEMGATVARYDLGHRVGLTAPSPLMHADPAKLAA